MTTRVRASIAFLVAFGLAAVSGCLEGLDGFSSGDADAGGATPEASTPADAAATADSSTGADASAGDDAAVVVCPGHPAAVFCDSFDDGVLAGHWTTFATGGTVAISDAASASPPASLLATIPASSVAGPVGEVNVYATVPFPAPAARVSADIYVDSFSERGAYLFVASPINGTDRRDINLFARNDGMKIEVDRYLADGGLELQNFPITAFAARTWVRAILDVDYGNAAAPTFSLTLESPPGTPAAPVLDHLPIAGPFMPSTLGVTVGLVDVNSPASVGWRVYIDGVVIEPR